MVVKHVGLPFPSSWCSAPGLPERRWLQMCCSATQELASLPTAAWAMPGTSCLWRAAMDQKQKNTSSEFKAPEAVLNGWKCTRPDTGRDAPRPSNSELVWQGSQTSCVPCRRAIAVFSWNRTPDFWSLMEPGFPSIMLYYMVVDH